MAWLIYFIYCCINILPTVFRLLVATVKDIVSIYNIIASVVSYLPGLLEHFLPSYIYSLLMVFLAVAVLYKILGREG